MADIFEEVEEQIRSDRYRNLAFKALPWVLGVLVLVLIVWVTVWVIGNSRRNTDAEASLAYASGIEALQSGDLAKAESQFAAAVEVGSPGYETLAMIQQAGLRLREEKTQEAVALLDQAAEQASSPLLADTARLQAVYAMMDSANRIEIEGRLKPLLDEGRPFRDHAREALAMVRLADGDADSARGEFVVLSQSLDTAPAVRQRAEAAVDLIDSGLAGSVPAVLKAAEALPEGGGSPPAQPSTPQGAQPETVQ